MSLIIALITEEALWETLTNLGAYSSSIFGLVFLLRNGTFRKTIFFNIAMLLFCITTLGILFKISHWPGSVQLLTIGLIGIVITYLVRFVKKPNKSRQDYLKFLWVTSAFIYSWSILMHLPLNDFVFIPNLILVLTIADFGYTCYRNKALLDK